MADSIQKLKAHGLYLICLLLLLTGCAKRGSITGGLKDTIPPQFMRSVPDNYSTNFKGNLIKLSFDEYVKLKDVNKQLVISPPMKNQPIITPTTASRDFTIKILDTLKPNTTYSFNFGQSVADNNEGNPLSLFRYVFSTGTYVDSLQIGGIIRDAYDRKPDNFVSIMLYEMDSTYTDSTIYKQTPRYITNTLDSLKAWKIENIKEGKYRLIAVKDKNNNNKYDPKSDKLAFLDKPVRIPNDTIFQLDLFKEEVPLKLQKPSLDAGHKFLVGYEGNPDNLQAEVWNGSEKLDSEFTLVPGKDSVNVWFPAIKADSLNLKLQKGAYTKDFWVKVKPQKKDSLEFKMTSSSKLSPRKEFIVESTIPVRKIDSTRITIRDKDSALVPFTTSYENLRRQLTLKFKREPSQKYKVQFLPGALTDFYEKTNDTLDYKVNTGEMAEYANIWLKLANVRKYPVIVELLSEKGDVKATAYSEDSPKIDFEGLDPGSYYLRVIYDENRNKRWDSGNYLRNIQPESVFYMEKPIEIKANWELEQDFKLP